MIFNANAPKENKVYETLGRHIEEIFEEISKIKIGLNVIDENAVRANQRITQVERDIISWTSAINALSNETVRLENEIVRLENKIK